MAIRKQYSHSTVITDACACYYYYYYYKDDDYYYYYYYFSFGLSTAQRSNRYFNN